MELSTIALKKMQAHPSLKNEIAVAFQKSEATVRRWIKSNHIMLTHDISVSLIEKATGLSKEKIIKK